MLEKWAYKKIIKYFLEIRKEKKNKEFIFDKNKPIFENEKKDIYFGVFLSFLIGCLATLPIVLVEVFFPGGDTLLHNQTIIKWSIYTLVLIFFVCIEFYLLYLIGFKTISHLIYKIYMLKNKKILNVNIKDKEFISSLARTSIEFEENLEDFENINLYHDKYKNKNKIFLTLMYKAKVMLTNFISKLILKKMLMRTGLRGYEPFIAIPITGIWDSFIFYKVIKETKFKLISRIEIELLFNKYIKIEEKTEIKKYIEYIYFRYSIYGEYNINLHYLLNKSLKYYETKYKEDLILNENTINKISKLELDTFDFDFIIITFAIKNNMFNKHEISYLENNNIYKNVINQRKKLKKGKNISFL